MFGRARLVLAGTLVALAAIVTTTSASAHEVVVANEGGRSLSIIDLRSGTTSAVALPIAPHNVQVGTDGRIYVVGMPDSDMASMPGMAHASGRLLVFSPNGLAGSPLLNVAVGVHPAHVVVDSQGTAYVSLFAESSVAVVDRYGRVVARVPVGSGPHGLRLSADGRRLYVANMEDDSLSVIDTAARREIARIHVGRSPVQVAVAPDGRHVYATLSGEDAVAIVDVAARRVVKKIRVGRSPAQLYLSANGTLVVADQGTRASPDSTTTLIAASSGRIVATLATGAGSHGVVVDDQGRYAYVTASFANTVTVIDLRRMRAIRRYRVGDEPAGITYR
jgi:YVTN family beta-propeller protein